MYMINTGVAYSCQICHNGVNYSGQLLVLSDYPYTSTHCCYACLLPQILVCSNHNVTATEKIKCSPRERFGWELGLQRSTVAMWFCAAHCCLATTSLRRATILHGNLPPKEYSCVGQKQNIHPQWVGMEECVVIKGCIFTNTQNNYVTHAILVIITM